MDPHKMVVRRSAFLAFSSAQNEGGLKGGVESEGLNINFHKWKAILIYKGCLN